MAESIKRGALTEAVFYILLSLHNPRHGYALMQEINEQTKGRVNLGAGTLYGALNTLTDQKWIQSIDNSVGTRKKEYLITDLGKHVFENEIVRLTKLLKDAETRKVSIEHDEEN